MLSLQAFPSIIAGDFTSTASVPATGTVAGGVTHLDVATIDCFEFDDVTFTYDQLF